MPRDSPTVPVVDDEGVVAEVYAALLGEVYDCQVAYSGAAALETY